MYAPIVVFSYNRLQHLKMTLDGLEKATNADRSELFIFADGFKGEKDKEAVLKVHQYLEQYKETGRFLKVTLYLSEHNRGLAESVIQGVSKVVQQYNRVIVVEDDMLVSKDFLVYMNAALEYYETKRNVWGISGWTPPIELDKIWDKDTYAWYRGSSWGWATWYDRWCEIDWEVKAYSRFRFSPSMRKRFNRGGADLADMLDFQKEGSINSWAIRCAYHISSKGLLVMFPTKTKVFNNGQDGSGTHCHTEKEASFADLDKHYQDKYVWGDPEVTPVLKKRLYRYYSGSQFHCFKWWIKSILRRYAKIRK